MPDITQYAGRLNDVAILHGVKSSGVQLLSMNLSGSEICTGVQKIVQNVVVLLLTEKGTDPYDAARGTDFMISVRQGLVVNSTEVKVSFSRAAEDIIQQLEASETEDTPDDERLTGLELLSFSFDGSTLLMTIKLTTAAADLRPVILPISIPLG